MDLTNFKNKLEVPPSGRSISYIKQYNEFWARKLHIEQENNHHILDTNHVKDTCVQLMKILPRWQTYRGVKCNYEKNLPLAITSISHAYNDIRRFSLLEFEQIPDDSLRFMWENLGTVKEKQCLQRPNLNYFVIAVCKPLMFIWGQTLAFDSINRINIRNDRSLQLTESPQRSSRWSFSQWKTIMRDFQSELLQSPKVIDYCRSQSLQTFGTDFIVPYGRYLDLYYYY